MREGDVNAAHWGSIQFTAHQECWKWTPVKATDQWKQSINSLARRRFERNFRYTIFKLVLVIDGWGVSCEISISWMPLDLTDDKSTLVQVMAWCRQATSHYLSQCWPSFLSPYGVTRPYWVNPSTSHYLSHCWLSTLSPYGVSRPQINQLTTGSFSWKCNFGFLHCLLQM